MGLASSYASLLTEIRGLLAGERDWLANLANAAALLGRRLPEINWAGFYLWRGDALVLGPFHGEPACVRIAEGRGVCGAAADRRATLIVADVLEFPGHIACDPRSRSEIVVPLLHRDRLLGVLDVDAPVVARFGPEDGVFLERFGRIVVDAADWPESIGRRVVPTR